MRLIVILIIASTLLSSCIQYWKSTKNTQEWNNAFEKNTEDTYIKSKENDSNIFLLIDNKRQNDRLFSYSWISIDLTNDLLADEGIISNTDWDYSCNKSQGIIKWGEEEDNVKSVYDIIMDLTYFDNDPNLLDIPKSRMNKVTSFLNWEIESKFKIHDWDEIIIRFIGTNDYWLDKANQILKGSVKIIFQDNKVKHYSIPIECVENKKKWNIYVKLVPSLITEIEKELPDINSKISKLDKFTLLPQDTKLYIADSNNTLSQIIEKEFLERFNAKIYNQWSFILDLIRETWDLLWRKEEKTINNVITVFFSDWQFQLHKNYKMGSILWGKYNIESLSSFSPELFHKYEFNFSKFYIELTKDEYWSELKQKCDSYNDLIFVWVNDVSDANFEKFSKEFYSEMLPKCNISFQ